MKALTIRQPWAWAIINADKDIENRSWPTRFRGTLAVHAAVTLPRYDYEDSIEELNDILLTTRNSKIKIPTFDELVRGAILGTVAIIDCVEDSESPWFQGDYGFVLANPKQLPKPIPCKGALNFWNIPENIERKIKNAI
jgi:hypothetical protein